MDVAVIVSPWATTGGMPRANPKMSGTNRRAPQTNLTTIYTIRVSITQFSTLIAANVLPKNRSRSTLLPSRKTPETDLKRLKSRRWRDGGSAVMEIEVKPQGQFVQVRVMRGEATPASFQRHVHSIRFAWSERPLVERHGRGRARQASRRRSGSGPPYRRAKPRRQRDNRRRAQHAQQQAAAAVEQACPSQQRREAAGFVDMRMQVP
ncbi:MAG: hypothetical protein FD157_2574 [Rhodocyclaceae bacterium]|nr:MAG: hypothetical protein FD157_2574 [Rhodocyclaceae bacterium]TND02005.1 MAG: hypothetical protein FD118_2035 [Rhodocyclaceae bacterium]